MVARRANSLRDILNVFPPEPLAVDKMDFYQPTAIARDGNRYEYHEMLFDHIISAEEPVHCLAIGHGGCGKSTEMRALARELINDEKATHSIIINATKDLNSHDFTYIDVVMIIVERLTEYAKENKISIHKGIIKAFNDALSTKITREHWERDIKASLEKDISAGVSIPFVAKLAAKITSSIKLASGLREELRLELRPKMVDVTEAVNAFIHEIKDSGIDIVIMIDGLEKCRHECVRTLFIEDGYTLASIKAHLVISCPISLYRSADATVLQSNFPLALLMPMIKTHNPDNSPYQKGIDAIKELILRRVDDVYFEAGVLERIIEMGGGNLRDTCHLLKESAFHAHMQKRETIDMDCFNSILDGYSTDVFLRVSNKFYPALKEIYYGNYDLENDEALNELLYAGAVFEYNTKRWKDLHPLIRYHIDKKPEILG